MNGTSAKVQVLSLSIVIWLLLSGCGTDVDSRELEEQLFAADLSQRAIEIDVKREEFIQTCMAEQGFTYEPNERPTTGFKFATERMSPEEAEADAYGFASEFLDLVGGGVDAAISSNSGDQSPDYLEALDGSLGGSEDSGCRVQAERSFPQVYEQFDNSTQQQIDRLNQATLDDPEYVAATSEWSNCMKSKGFTVPDPSRLLSELIELDEQLRATIDYEPSPDGVYGYDSELFDKLAKLERETARADAECSAGLTDLYTDIFKRKLRES